MPAPRNISTSLRLVENTAESDALIDRARQLFPTPEYQQKWLAAVHYLRERSQRGWILDARIPRREPQ